MSAFFHNKPVKAAVLILLSVYILSAVSGCLILYQNSRAMITAFVRQDVALAGGMSLHKPAGELSVISGKIEQNDLKAGTALLQPYSYDDKIPLAVNRYYSRIFDNQLFVFITVTTVIFLAALAVTLFVMSGLYKKIRVLAAEANLHELSREHEDFQISSGEGDFAALQSAVNALSERLSFHADALAKDKDYLIKLLSDISHQLKTPLAALRMYNEILIDKKDLAADKRAEFLLRSRSQIDRTDWLIQGLLKMARLEAGAVVMSRQQRYLTDTVGQAAAPFYEFARQKGVAVSADIPPEICFCHDSDWVAEAFGNIIKNALEHTSAGGKITVSCAETPLTVAVKISDTGEGMESCEIPHVFERFYHKDSATNPGSAGIGLSLAKDIIEKNDGEIFVILIPNKYIPLPPKL